MRIPDHIIAQIKSAANIVDVLKRSGVPLIKRGAVWVCCCPFHQEDTPSFTVNPRRQSFKCWGGSCDPEVQRGGDVFKFFMLRDRMDFPQAVRHVAYLVNLTHLLPHDDH